jgi:hypothetical protein
LQINISIASRGAGFIYNIAECKFSGIGLEQILISVSIAGDISADGVIAADIEDVRRKSEILCIAASINRNRIGDGYPAARCACAVKADIARVAAAGNI